MYTIVAQYKNIICVNTVTVKIQLASNYPDTLKLFKEHINCTIKRKLLKCHFSNRPLPKSCLILQKSKNDTDDCSTVNV